MMIDKNSVMEERNALDDRQAVILQTFQTIMPLSAKEALIMAQSDFLFDQLRRSPHWLTTIRSDPPSPIQHQTYASKMAALLSTVEQENDVMRCVRQFRHHQMMRIAWSQLTQSCTTAESLLQLSELADVIVMQTTTWIYQRLCQAIGTPHNEAGEPQTLYVIAMGKLGGRELNFSSDIDLIFAYPEKGMTQGGMREIDNAQFFTRLGQQVIKVLNQSTVDGVAYRVDLRLRPFGESGPLVLTFLALEYYYQDHGRDWERYAMVKARILGSDSRYNTQLRQLLQAFVYRRYFDFSVLGALRQMKVMMTREVERRALYNNIKLGAGGIREIEFIVQALQLIRGGRETDLQSAQLLVALDVIGKRQLLPPEIVQRLSTHYLFLRRLENLLQAIHDKQTQTLPKNRLDQVRLAIGMGMPSWQVLLSTLNEQMAATRQIFVDFIGEGKASTNRRMPQETLFDDLWLASLTSEELHALRPTLLPETCNALITHIQQFKRDVEHCTMGTRGREVLDLLMPRLLAKIVCHQDATVVLPLITSIVSNILSRTTYLELLLEYDIVRDHLVVLCAASPMIAMQIAHYPMLLDELLDQQHRRPILSEKEYKDEFHYAMLRIPDDEEEQLEALKYFKQVELLHIAAADITDQLPTMKVSDHLTFLAEAMLHFVVQLAWNQMVKKYGKPSYLSYHDDKGLAVIGYGKIGGWELGYGSDLDLIFLTTCPKEDYTDGDRQIHSRDFYQRLVQRIIHLFSIRTTGGVLYPVDMRLRPAGDAGLLVSSFAAFEKYQQQHAWTWEHQALVRARVIYGNTQLKQQFNAIRCQVLCLPRDATRLQKHVNEMMGKRRAQCLQQSDKFDLKIGHGSIGDIEFIAQYLVLMYAHQVPELTKWTDNVRIFDLLAYHHIMPQSEAEQLKQVYIMLRNTIHHLSLQARAPVVSIDEFESARATVQRSWQKWLRADVDSSSG